MVDFLYKDLEKMAIDKFHQVTIYDTKFNRPMYKNVDYDFLVDNYEGKKENFIQDIKSSAKAIKVFRMRKNGSTSKRISEPYEVIFEASASTPLQTSISFENTPVPTSVPMQMPVYEPAIIPNTNKMSGLNEMENAYKIMHFPELKRQIDKLEIQNETLKKDNDNLSKKIFEYETEKKFDSKEIERDERKSANNREILGMAMPALAPVLEKLMASKTGLSEPAQLPKYDAQITQILDVTGNLLTRSEDFYIELDDLLKKYLQK